jgi:predicted  nucleic acid-binding Zn-ribbon protein
MKNSMAIILWAACIGFSALQAQEQQVDANTKAVVSLNKRVETLEARMGRNVTTPTATNNLERRLDDIEKRLDDLEKTGNSIEKLERRVRDLERKK